MGFLGGWAFPKGVVVFRQSASNKVGFDNGSFLIRVGFHQCVLLSELFSSVCAFIRVVFIRVCFHQGVLSSVFSSE